MGVNYGLLLIGGNICRISKKNILGMSECHSFVAVILNAKIWRDNTHLKFELITFLAHLSFKRTDIM